MNKTSTIIAIVVGGFTVLGMFGTLLFFVIKAQVASEVTAQFKAAGIVPPAKIEAMEGDIEDNSDDIEKIQTRWNALIDAVAAQRVTEE